MTNAANIDVLLGLPDWIVKGLQDGTLERVGGVIRDKVANKWNLKPIRAWLREGQLADAANPSQILQQQMGQLLMQNDVIGQQMGQLLMQNSIMMGMQVASMAINIAGFAILYYKMDRIEKTLNQVNSRLISLQEGQERAEIRGMISHLAPVVAAMETLSNADVYSNRQLFENRILLADNDMAIAQRYFHGVLLHILDRKVHNPAEVHLRFEEMSSCYRAWIAASQGRLQAHAILDENPVALRMAQALKKEHAEVGNKIVEVVGDTDTRLILGKDGDGISAQILQFGHQAKGVHEIISGNVLQLEFQKENRLVLPASVDEQVKNHSGFVVYMPKAA